jgi:hypothetical protein
VELIGNQKIHRDPFVKIDNMGFIVKKEKCAKA